MLKQNESMFFIVEQIQQKSLSNMQKVVFITAILTRPLTFAGHDAGVEVIHTTLVWKCSTRRLCGGVPHDAGSNKVIFSSYGWWYEFAKKYEFVNY